MRHRRRVRETKYLLAFKNTWDKKDAKKFECFTQKKSYIDVKAQRKGTGRKLTRTLRGNTQLEAGQQAKRFKKEFPCVKEFSNFNFLGLSYLFDMIFCVLKP